MKSNDINWNKRHSSEITWNNMKSVEIMWNRLKSQVKSNQVKWNQLKRNEIKWHQLKSSEAPPLPPQSLLSNFRPYRYIAKKKRERDNRQKRTQHIPPGPGPRPGPGLGLPAPVGYVLFRCVHFQCIFICSAAWGGSSYAPPAFPRPFTRAYLIWTWFVLFSLTDWI